MAATPETGFLVIADLTGYTAYLSGSEIEHAPAIAGDLLETIVGRLEPPFRLAKFEGDAAFLFVEDGRADGSLLLDAIEAAYLAFRRRLRSIDQATTCDCNSCRLAPRLDLKVFVHHGAFVRSRIAGRDELAGSGRHRRPPTAEGRRAPPRRARNGFALFTGRRRRRPRSRSRRPGAPSRARSRSSTSAASTRSPWISRPAGRPRAASAGSTSPTPTSSFDVEATLAAEPSVVWAHLTSPALRTRWEGPIVIEETSAGGRRGVGTTAQCVTGRLATLEEIVDWQPYDRVAWRLAVPGRRSGRGHRGSRSDRRAGRVSGSAGRYQGGAPADADAVERMRVDKEAAYARLATVIAGALPVVEQREAREHDPVPERADDRAIGDGRLGVRRGHRPPSGVDERHRRADRARDGRPRSAPERTRTSGSARSAWDVEFEVAEAEPGRRIAWNASSRAPIRSATSRWTSKPIGPEIDQGDLRADIRLTRARGGCVGRWSRWRAKAGAGARTPVRLKERVEAAPAVAPAMS